MKDDEKETELKDITDVRVSEFNDLPLDMQLAIISRFQQKPVVYCEESLTNIRNILSYFEGFEWENIAKYISIRSEEDEFHLKKLLKNI